jgi:hypothetical protein
MVHIASNILDARPLLMCWKDIAFYVNKSRRTVQRWEQMYGMPVRRPSEHPKSPVLAIPAEIDAWLQSRPSITGRVGTIASQLATLISALKDSQAENEALQVRVDGLQAENTALQAGRASLNPVGV